MKGAAPQRLNVCLSHYLLLPSINDPIRKDIIAAATKLTSN